MKAYSLLSSLLLIGCLVSCSYLPDPPPVASRLPVQQSIVNSQPPSLVPELRATETQKEVLHPHPQKIKEEAFAAFPGWSHGQGDLEMAQDYMEEILLLLQKRAIDPRQISLQLWYLDQAPFESISFRAEELVVGASTVKIPLAMVILDAVYEGDATLQTLLRYQAEDWEGGSGQLQDAPVGSRYSIKELLQRSIQDSDNIATNILLRWLKNYNGSNGMEQVRLRFHLPLGEGNRVSARAMAEVQRELLDNPRQNPYYIELKSWLQHSNISYLGRSYPANFAFEHKYGYYEGCYAEVLSVRTARPYILSVYLDSQGRGEKEVIDFLDDLGRLLFEKSQS